MNIYYTLLKSDSTIMEDKIEAFAEILIKHIRSDVHEESHAEPFHSAA